MEHSSGDEPAAVRVDYELTGLGRSLLGLVNDLVVWSEKHIFDVAAARDAFDARAAVTG